MDRHLLLKPKKHSNSKISQRPFVERKDAIWLSQMERNKRFKELQRESRRQPKSKILPDNLPLNKITTNYFVLVSRTPFRHSFNVLYMYIIDLIEIQFKYCASVLPDRDEYYYLHQFQMDDFRLLSLFKLKSIVQ